eukprot:9482520-Pyramimonas_sp.AAC.1
MRRFEHRTEGASAVKRTNQHCLVVASGEPRPKTPDPSARDVTRRRWETSVQVWRAELNRVRPL